METPEQVIARLRADAASLRRRGFGGDADRLAEVAEEFARALAPLEFVPEHVAMNRSGRRLRWLRERHEDWMRVGAAAFDADGNRLYRLCVLPTQLARAVGEADAERALEAS
jgi:hypothetical protein